MNVLLGRQHVLSPTSTLLATASAISYQVTCLVSCHSAVSYVASLFVSNCFSYWFLLFLPLLLFSCFPFLLLQSDGLACIFFCPRVYCGSLHVQFTMLRLFAIGVSVSYFGTTEIVSLGRISARTLVVLDVDGWKYQFHVKNKHTCV